jgi:hypothetical protein
MKRNSSIAAVLLALGCCAALAAAPLKIIALQVRVSSLNGSSNGTFDVGDAIPVQVGEQVRIDLVGTAIVNGAGVETPINARFSVGAGAGNVGIARGGPNWVVVNVNNAGGNGLAQLAYATTGNYDIKPGLQSGRITLKIGGSGAGAPAPQDVEDRAAKARRLNALLYRAILGEPPSGPQAQADFDRIYRNGYRGVVEVADALARRAEAMGRGRAPYERGYEQADIERVGGLYRGLLGRQLSNQELWQTDGGFRDNVRALHEKGLVAVVHGLVTSDELISHHRLDGF